MDNPLLYLLVVFLVAAIGFGITWWRHRPQTSATESVEDFWGQMAALAPDRTDEPLVVSRVVPQPKQPRPVQDSVDQPVEAADLSAPGPTDHRETGRGVVPPGAPDMNRPTVVVFDPLSRREQPVEEPTAQQPVIAVTPHGQTGPIGSAAEVVRVFEAADAEQAVGEPGDSANTIRSSDLGEIWPET